MEKEQTTKVISSRRLLKKLREVMSAVISVQEKLNRIVDVVASEMQTDVCSFYLLQPGDILELFAAYGLKQSSIHETSLRLGEGLIGEIAVQKKALSFDDVWHHPSFVFKPETGEKIYRTLMGVPVLQGTHLLGVLAVQTEELYIYTEEEIETLETVAMLIAQILLSVDFKSRQNTFVKVNKDVRSRIEGVRLMSGMAIGTAFVHARTGRIENLISSNNDVKDQLRNGLGLYISDKLRLFGNWTDNSLNGIGVMTDEYGIYVGEFYDNCLNGFGVFLNVKGDLYIGEFNDGDFYGEGILYYENDTFHKGQFKDNRPYGEGEYFNENEELIVGDFTNANYVNVYFELDKNGRKKED